MEKSIAIVTARGGSKRIPGKNIKEFCGKPIISYSIVAALQSGIFDEVMVSTDSEEIASIATEYGAKVPFKRSDKASDDVATTSDVLLEVLDEYETRGINFEYACCIYPTAPFVTKERLKQAMCMMKDKDIDIVIPVTAFSYPPQRGLVVRNDLLQMQYPQYIDTRSQDLETIYHDCGQFYLFKVNHFRKTKRLMEGKMIPIIISETEVQDIDTIEDWKLAELKFHSMEDRNEL